MDNDSLIKDEGVKIITSSYYDCIDYNAHLQTLKEFDKIYEKMYITEENKCGRWILK
jgi:hypothetical protein